MAPRIGAQLYTVRRGTTTLEDFAETLKRVADIGYEFVQVSGTCAYEPEWLAEQLKKTGLQCPITHTSNERMIEMPETVAKEHEVFGCHYIGVGYYNIGKFGLDDFAEKFLPVSDAFRANGKKLMYHNHAVEFAKWNGRCIMEQLAERFTADQLGFTLDTYWVQRGGGDAAQWLRKLSGRVDCIHFKDMGFKHLYAPDGTDKGFDCIMAPIGEGNMNFESIFAAAEDAGVRYAFVEQDDCYEDDPFDCLKRSYDYLTSCGLK